MNCDNNNLDKTLTQPYLEVTRYVCTSQNASGGWEEYSEDREKTEPVTEIRNKVFNEESPCR